MTQDYLSEEKHKELQKELAYLQNEGRTEVANRLEYAKSLGDLSENAEYHAARSYVYCTAHQMKLLKSSHRIDSDGVKLFAAPVAKKIADRAIQVLGGNGYVGVYNFERMWRDAKLLEIGGGTNEAHQKNITSDILKNPHLLHNL